MRSFFRKLHHRDDSDGNERQSQSYEPPPSYSSLEGNRSDKKPSSSSAYNHQQETSSSSSTQYAPPPGPPPNWTAPAAAAAPSASTAAADPPPYHDWTIIPDNALLPPPPPLTYTVSPTANASAADGEAAYQWCLAHPLSSPLHLTPAQLAALRAGHVAFAAPPSCFAGELRAAVGTGSANRPGRYAGRSHSRARDVCLVTALPLYSARAHNPLLQPPSPKPATTTVYFELGILGIGGIASSVSSPSLEEADAGLAIGYVAPPYPSWRLPGWQRGSLGVHGDDGRRYVNDTFGGADFTTAWRAGERVGLGLVFRARPTTGETAPPPAYGGGGIPRVAVDVFFTRNGQRAGGWNMAGELDERALGGKEGLEGECDLYGAVGLFGGVDFEVFFNREDWLFKPGEKGME
ncbi:hypothetical protein BKA80DRAFT_284258 [Phyllosticta citrichinensis]